MANQGSPAITALEQEIAAIEKAQEPTRAKIAELEAELVEGAQIVARNKAAIDLLTGKTRIGDPAPSRSRATRGPAVSEGEREAAVIAALNANPEGLNGTELAGKMGVSAATGRKTLDVMEKAGTIRKTGNKKTTKFLAA